MHAPINPLQIGDGFCFVNRLNPNQYAKPTKAAGKPPRGRAKKDARILLIRAIGIRVSHEGAESISLRMP